MEESIMAKERISWELRQSMGEELSAGSVYQIRALNAEKDGDFKTANLYREISNDEIADHYLKFAARLKELGYYATPQ